MDDKQEQAQQQHFDENFENNPDIMGPCGKMELNIGRTQQMEPEKLNGALAMLRKSLKRKEQTLGPDDTSILNTKNSISSLLQRQGKYEESLNISRNVYEKRNEILGPTHPDTLASNWNIALCLHHLKKYDEALEIAYEVDKKREKRMPDHPCVIKGKELIADILFDQNKLVESIRIYENVYEKKVKVLGEKHKDNLDIIYKMGLVLTELERYIEAIQRFEMLVNITKEIFGPNDERTLEIESVVKLVLNDTLFRLVTPDNCDFIVVKTLLQKGADVNAFLDNGLRPLHFAAQNGDSELAKLLLSKGAVINAKTYNHTTALHIAVTHEHYKVFELLLNKGADINVKNIKQITPLYIATQTSNIAFVEQLLKKDASINTKALPEGYTPLHIAVMNGDSSIVELLLNKGADINAGSLEEVRPLHLAIDGGDIDIIDILLERGASIDVKDKNRTTPLHLAALNNHPTVVASLLNKGANVNCYDIVLLRPIHFAAQEGHTKIVKYLLKHNADIEANCSMEITVFNKSFVKTSRVMGLTALHVAALKKHIDVVRALLEAGANIDAINELNETPAESAIEDSPISYVILSTKILPNVIRQNKNPSIIQQLLEDGAVINHFSDTTRLTALHYAVCRGCPNIVKLLLKKNPNVNVTDEDGWSPLHYAAQDGYLDIVQLLLDKGANAEIKNKDRQTPLDIARQKFAYDTQIYQKIIDILKA